MQAVKYLDSLVITLKKAKFKMDDYVYCSELELSGTVLSIHPDPSKEIYYVVAFERRAGEPINLLRKEKTLRKK